MPVVNHSFRSPWTRLRAPFAVVAVAVLFGGAVVAPFSMPSAQADEAAFQARITQEFVPNENPEDDLVFAEVPTVTLPDPEEERKRLEAEKAAAEAEAAKKDQSSSASAPARYTGGGAPAEWMAAAGIPESDWFYVDQIVSRESGWNPNATNATSGACGLAQALPCSKVPGGNGYDPVANLIWANQYAHTCVSGRMYCGWKGAFDFWQANDWW
ncbi:hypothetical protein J4H91_12365 [Leucobacter ruminantium]|uniref:Transglycosylase SLT domain-containing protein n=1 Tax=Leucobacter ruminantium TaxID=1289170 RepID=A0A939LWH9_9MICO|nr:hypothetical protein [Leucobacter ruminantium]